MWALGSSGGNDRQVKGRPEVARGVVGQVSGICSASSPDQGERKITVLDTDYTRYMFFCMEAPAPGAESGMVCQYLGA